MTWSPPSNSCGEINSAPSRCQREAKKASVADLPEITWLGGTSAQNENKVILVGKVPLTHGMNVISGVMFSPFHWARFLFFFSVFLQTAAEGWKHWDWNLLRAKAFFPHEEFYCTWGTGSDQNCRHSLALYYLKNWGHSFSFTLNKLLLYLWSSWANPCVFICVGLLLH